MAEYSEDIEQARALVKEFKELKEAAADAGDVFKQADNLVKKFNKDIKDSQPASKMFKDMLAGNAKQLESSSDAAKKFDKAIKAASESADVLKEANLAQEKTETLKRIATSNARTAAVNFGVGLGGVTKAMLSGATEFVKGLQGTQEGTELSGQAALKAAEATGKVADTMGALAQSIGLLMTVLPIGRVFKAVGVGLAALGIGLEAIGPALSEAATEGVKILNTELEKTKKSFRDITSTGAEFAGGMTELRKISAEAGLDVGQMASIVKSNTENLSNMGLGVAESIKRFSGINKELRNSPIGLQLRKLGLSTEEQGEMAIRTAAMLNSSGQLRSMNDKQVAATTLEYTKYLKILSNLTGEDATKKLEEARTKALEVDILAKLMSEGGQDAVNKFNAQYAQLPDVLKKGYLELISTGGQAIVDGSTNVFLAQVPQARTQLQKMFSDLSAPGIGFEEAGLRALELSKATALATVAAKDALAPIGTAGRLMSDGLAQGATDIANGVILFNTKFAESSVRLSETATDAAARNQEALDRRVAAIDEGTQKLKADLGTALTGPLTVYTGVLATGTEAVKNFETAIKNATEAAGGTTTESKSSQTSTGTPGFFERLYESTFTSKTRKERQSMNSSSAVSGVTGEPFSPGFAQGGISTGPLSGYQEVLHGTEAVVPLPDNRSIPVTLTNSQSNSGTMDSKEMVSAIRQQSGILNQILTTMEKNNQLTSGILQTSY
jgi:hypothetical protein